VCISEIPKAGAVNKTRTWEYISMYSSKESGVQQCIRVLCVQTLCGGRERERGGDMEEEKDDAKTGNFGPMQLD
jgi:hypothetical protein